MPDLFLKSCSAQREWNDESLSRTTETLLQLPAQLAQHRIIAGHKRQFEFSAHLRATLFQSAPVSKLALTNHCIAGAGERGPSGVSSKRHGVLILHHPV